MEARPTFESAALYWHENKLALLYDSKLAAEVLSQCMFHGSARGIYLLQVALNDVAARHERWLPEDGQMCEYTIRLANQLDGPTVAARVKAISPRKQIAA